MARMRSIKPATYEFDDINGESASSGCTWYLYCVAEVGSEDGPCKIGFTSTLSNRLSNLQAGNWRELTFAWVIQFPTQEAAKDMEQRCLCALRPDIYSATCTKKRLKSEWVDCSPMAALAKVSQFFEILQTPLRKIA